MHMFLHMTFPILLAMLVAMCCKKCSAPLWRSPSTDVTTGVNVSRLSSTDFLYSFFFSEPLRPKFVLVFDAGGVCVNDFYIKQRFKIITYVNHCAVNH